MDKGRKRSPLRRTFISHLITCDNMAFSATVRRWGSSLAVTLPRETVKRLSLREGEKVLIEVKKENPLREVFGKGKLDKPIERVMREIDSELWGEP